MTTVETRFPDQKLVLVQLMLAAFGFAAFTFAPPVSGKMILVPVLPGSSTHISAFALAHGARLVGVGPFSGSLVVVGDRGALLADMFRAGGLVLSAPPTSCEDQPGKRDKKA